jgi:hypothetical protein
MGVGCVNKNHNILYPPAPILNSNALRIQFYFGGLLLLTLTLVGQTACT